MDVTNSNLRSLARKDGSGFDCPVANSAGLGCGRLWRQFLEYRASEAYDAQDTGLNPELQAISRLRPSDIST